MLSDWMPLCDEAVSAIALSLSARRATIERAPESGGTCTLNLLAAGFLAQIVGLLAWSRARGSKWPAPLFWTGLAMLLTSLALPLTTMSTALALSWALLMVSIAAYGTILPRLCSMPRIGKESPRARDRAARPVTTLNGAVLAVRLTAAGPLYLLASMAVGCLLATRTPWLDVNRLMLGGLVVPVVWAAGALHATADLQLWRVVLLPVLLTLVFFGLYLLL